MQYSVLLTHGALMYGCFASDINYSVQAVIEKERRGDFLGKTVQVCSFLNCSGTFSVFVSDYLI